MRGSRPVPQECGILMGAICTDKPAMSAKGWQIEMLWLYLITVGKSSWRMWQTPPTPRVLRWRLFFLVILKSDWKVWVYSFCFYFYLTFYFYFGCYLGALTCRVNSSMLLLYPARHYFLYTVAQDTFYVLFFDTSALKIHSTASLFGWPG